MASILEVQDKLIDFFGKELKKDANAIRVIEVSKAEDGWIGILEITETNLYLKKMGYPLIYDKNVYRVMLDDNLNVLSYKQQIPGREEEVSAEGE